jgi:hypothetical protein
VQRELEETHRRQFVGLSLADTVYNLVLVNEHKRAASLCDDFELSQKQCAVVVVVVVVVMSDTVWRAGFGGSSCARWHRTAAGTTSKSSPPRNHRSATK